MDESFLNICMLYKMLSYINAMENIFKIDECYRKNVIFL